MRKYFILGIVAMSVLTSCTDKSKEAAAQQELERQEALAQATRQELEAAVSERDELLSLVNEINANIEEIKAAEKVISINGGGELSTRTEVSNNLDAIKATLAERRQKLANLEAKLRDSKLSNDKLLSTIEGLRRQIDDQTQQIDRLNAELASAHQHIAVLDNKVDSLNTTVRNVTDERNLAQEEAIRQANLANECYIAIGSKKELKEHGIIESGFLRKTKIMQGEFDKSFFIQADKRNLSTIPLHSNKAKIVSKSQPEGSYEIIDQNGQKVLRILNPSAFWGTSNFVVIQID